MAQSEAAGGGASILQQRYDAAQRYQAANDLEHAAQQYRIFLSDALGQIALGYASAGEYDKAAADFDEALRLVPDFPMMQLAYARAAVDNGRDERARLLAADLVARYPKNVKVCAGADAVLGKALLKLDKSMEAKQAFEAAVALDPTFENGYELAVADLNLGDEKGAAKIFSEMVASYGDTAELHLYFGQAYGNSDFQADAVEELKQAIAKNDRLPGAHYALAALYLATSGSSKLVEAESELRKEIEVSPKNAAAYAALGHLLAGQGERTEPNAPAEEDLKRATELDPTSPDGFLYLGQYYAERKEAEKAEAALRQSIVLTVDVSRNAYQVQKAHYLLGRLLMQAGKVDEGKREIEISQQLMQENLSRDQNRLSEYLQDRSKDEAAAAPAIPMDVGKKATNLEAERETLAFEKQIGPALADSYNNLGAIAGGEGQYREAMVSFQHAAQWNAALPGLDANLGRAAYEAGALAEAEAPLTRQLQQHPEADDVRAMLGMSEFATKDYAAVRKTLAPLADKPDAAPRLKFAYAKALVETGDVKAGMARLIELEKAQPNVAELHRGLAEAYARENSALAVAEFEEATKLDPADAEAYAELGRFEMAHGQVREAVVNFDAALKLRPEDAALQQELAAAQAKVKR
jgi:tetratricopeptide (TPR) repeat protein